MAEIYPKGIYDFGMKIKNECPTALISYQKNGMGGKEKKNIWMKMTGTG
ncbi:MAG: hypothetical protein ACLRQF_20255 [Thomasclavelia ramosa]